MGLNSIVKWGNWGPISTTLFSAYTNEYKNKMKIPHDVLAYWASRPVLKVLDIAAILDRDHFWCAILNCPSGVIGDPPGAIEDRSPIAPHCILICPIIFLLFI